jgi:hypothetical protein
MSCNDHNTVRSGRVVSLLRAFWLVATGMFAAPAALAIDSGDIVVVSLRGEVHVTINGAPRKMRAGGVLELPASIRTGRDGAIELRQGATSVSVGPETLLEFPALERRGAPVDRIVQPRGNAFYNIGKREGRKLRVETPYLVGVIKGTQFNVAARDDSTTISLFEGLLEVRAADDSAIVDLKAGEIAARRRGEQAISVSKMDGAQAPPSGARQQDAREDGELAADDSRPAPMRGSDLGHERNVLGGLIDAAHPGNAPIGVSAELRPGIAVSTDAAPDTSASVGISPVPADGADVGVSTAVSAGPVSADLGASPGADVATNINVGTGPVATDVSPSTSVDVGPGGADVEVSTSTQVSAGPAAVDVDTSTSVSTDATGVAVDLVNSVDVEAGPVTVDVDTSASVDAGGAGVATDVDASAAVDAGPVTVDVDTSTSVDVGGAGVSADVSADTGVDAGPLTTDVDTSVTVDASTGAVDAGVDTSVAAGDVQVPVGVETSVELSTGTVDLGLNVGGLDADLGVDLGAGDEQAADTGSSTETTTDTGNDGSTDVGGLLDGLLRRPGRR